MVNGEFQRKRDTLLRTRNINIKHGQIMAAEAQVRPPVIPLGTYRLENSDRNCLVHVGNVLIHVCVILSPLSRVSHSFTPPPATQPNIHIPLHLSIHHPAPLPHHGQDDGMVFLNDNPLVVLMEYMRLMNLRLVDLFTSLDKDGSWSLSRDEFKQGLMVSAA